MTDSKIIMNAYISIKDKIEQAAASIQIYGNQLQIMDLIQIDIGTQTYYLQFYQKNQTIYWYLYCLIWFPCNSLFNRVILLEDSMNCSVLSYHVFEQFHKRALPGIQINAKQFIQLCLQSLFTSYNYSFNGKNCTLHSSCGALLGYKYGNTLNRYNTFISQADIDTRRRQNGTNNSPLLGYYASPNNPDSN